MAARARCSIHRRIDFKGDDDRLRIAAVARDRFRLAAMHPIHVEQLGATEPGFPPFETRITFWTGNEREHRYRVFKPAADVGGSDLPPWWMKDAIIVSPWPSCDCCG
jgi:nitrate reductase delta subunit